MTTNCEQMQEYMREAASAHSDLADAYQAMDAEKLKRAIVLMLEHHATLLARLADDPLKLSGEQIAAQLVWVGCDSYLVAFEFLHGLYRLFEPGGQEDEP